MSGSASPWLAVCRFSLAVTGRTASLSRSSAGSAGDSVSEHMNKAIDGNLDHAKHRDEVLVGSVIGVRHI